MDMPERPVIVPEGGELVRRAGRVGLVGGVARRARVQEADVQGPRLGRRPGAEDALGAVASGEALGVDHQVQVRELHAARVPGGRHRHVGRRLQVAGDLARCVVVAGGQDDPDPRLAEPGHLGVEEEAGVVVAPVDVVQVAREEHQAHLLRDRQIHEGSKRFPGCPSDPVHRGPLVSFEPAQGAIEVNVGRVQDRERRH